jgi:hypothetical protein
MKPVVGHLWGEDWNGFRLSVVGAETGFRSVVIEPWDGEGRMCTTVYATEAEARRRCWGMVRQACEVKAAQAAERMANASRQDRREATYPARDCSTGNQEDA